MRKRRAGWWFAAAGALLGAGLALGEISGWPFLRAPLQSTLTGMAAGPVLLEGGFHLRMLWRPTLRVEHLHIPAAEGVEVPYLLDAQHVDLGWRWANVWQWRRGAPLRIQRLHAHALTAHLVRDREGRGSWPRSRSAAEPSPVAWDLPRVGSLRVGQGLIMVDDAPWQTQLRVELRGGEGDEAAQDAGYRVSVNGVYRALPLALQLRAGGVLPMLQDPQAGPAAADVPLRVEGRVGAATLLFDGRAGALLGDRRLQGALRLRGLSLARVGDALGLTLPQTPPFDLKAQLGHAGGVWHLRVERAAVGSSLLNGDFRLDTRVQPPLLQGRLEGRRLGLVDLGPAVGVPEADAASVQRGRVLPQRRFDLPSLREMNADIQVAIDELDFGSDALNPLLDLRTKLQLQGGVLHLQDLKAHVAGGRFRGTTSLDANVEPARWTVDLRFEGVDIAGWVAGLRPPKEGKVPSRPDGTVLKQQRQQARKGGEQPARAYLTGALSGAVKATGRGRSAAEILGSLDGRAQLTLGDGTLSHLATEALGLDVAESLGVLVRGDQPLPLRCGWLDLVLRDGVVRPQLAVIDNDDTEVRIGGQVNLRDEKLALRLVARPKDISPFTLRSPVTLRGTLAAPAVGVESERLAGKALGAVVLGAAINPLAALLPFIDLGVGHDNDACARKPPKPPAAPASAPVAAR
jgi:AsmA family protein